MLILLTAMWLFSGCQWMNCYDSNKRDIEHEVEAWMDDMRYCYGDERCENGPIYQGQNILSEIPSPGPLFWYAMCVDWRTYDW